MSHAGKTELQVPNYVLSNTLFNTTVISTNDQPVKLRNTPGNSRLWRHKRRIRTVM
jgi:hypothetical protein